MSLRSLLLLVLLPIVSGYLQFSDWQCGHTEDTHRMLYSQAMQDCEDVATDWNHCCVKHDECYVRQRGQVVCDDEFCQCHSRAAVKRNSSSLCHSYSTLACVLMPFAGHEAYKNSINYSEPTTQTKHVPWDLTLAKDYSRLYVQCSQSNLTISSCSLKFDECSDSAEECRTGLCGCIREAYEMDRDVGCDRETTHMCNILASQPSGLTRLFSKGSRAFEWSPYLVSTLLLIAIWCICCCRCTCTLKKKNPKYTNVNV